MQLTVQPTDVHAAATRLLGIASQLDDAIDGFSRTAAAAGPDLGRDAVDGASQAARATVQAASVIVGNIHTLATALRELAEVYARLDSTAMPASP